jgi:FKBP-type peptidyl-prolyl cis-trans isomerase SlyD
LQRVAFVPQFAAMKIEPGKRVSVNYSLYADGPEKELIEETRKDDPMQFTFGEDPMLPKFEAALLGLEAGDTFTIAIPAAEAYGDEQEALFIEYPKSTFIEEGELDEELFQEGEIIPLESPEGDIIEGVVCEVKLNSIVLDFNHPLAGEDLLFEGEVLSVE